MHVSSGLNEDVFARAKKSRPKAAKEEAEKKDRRIARPHCTNLRDVLRDGPCAALL